MIWWEDFKVGEREEIGRHCFTEAEIVEFARKFDPQPFHVDAQAAGKSFFGGLIASGWHTCAIGMRLMVERYVNQTRSLGSPGLDNIRWLKPVRPGDTLTYSRIVLESRPSASRSDVGLIKSRWEALNQDGELVMSMEGW
ncbi:MAG TPA: MaoC family dehydratase, partial [Burkholderiales bacterium]|nr:MaoC family dehydratase [Burkholderiales bacterium]